MRNQVGNKESKKRAILYCRSANGNNVELQRQKDVLDEYAKVKGCVVIRIYLESGTMGALTYKSLRLQAKYHEFDELLITELAVLGNSPIEITEEVSHLAESGVRVMSIKDGELNVETLPSVFRKYFRLKYNLIRERKYV